MQNSTSPAAAKVKSQRTGWDGERWGVKGCLIPNTNTKHQFFWVHNLARMLYRPGTWVGPGARPSVLKKSYNRIQRKSMASCLNVLWQSVVACCSAPPHEQEEEAGEPQQLVEAVTLPSPGPGIEMAIGISVTNPGPATTSQAAAAPPMGVSPGPRPWRTRSGRVSRPPIRYSP